MKGNRLFSNFLNKCKDSPLISTSGRVFSDETVYNEDYVYNAYTYINIIVYIH